VVPLKWLLLDLSPSSGMATLLYTKQGVKIKCWELMT